MWGLAVWDRVSDPVMRPRGPLVMRLKHTDYICQHPARERLVEVRMLAVETYCSGSLAARSVAAFHAA